MTHSRLSDEEFSGLTGKPKRSALPIIMAAILGLLVLIAGTGLFFQFKTYQMVSDIGKVTPQQVTATPTPTETPTEFPFTQPAPTDTPTPVPPTQAPTPTPPTETPTPLIGLQFAPPEGALVAGQEFSVTLWVQKDGSPAGNQPVTIQLTCASCSVEPSANWATDTEGKLPLKIIASQPESVNITANIDASSTGTDLLVADGNFDSDEDGWPDWFENLSGSDPGSVSLTAGSGDFYNWDASKMIGTLFSYSTILPFTGQGKTFTNSDNKQINGELVYYRGFYKGELTDNTLRRGEFLYDEKDGKRFSIFADLSCNFPGNDPINQITPINPSLDCQIVGEKEMSKDGKTIKVYTVILKGLFEKTLITQPTSN